MPFRLCAALLILLSGCGFDSFQLSGRSTASQPPSGTFFEERGEADAQPNSSAPTEGGGEVTLE